MYRNMYLVESGGKEGGSWSRAFVRRGWRTGGIGYAARADNLWITGESDTWLQMMMKELAAGIARKGMEPKQESLWGTSTYAKEVDGLMVIEGARKFWVMSFVQGLIILD